MGGRSRVMNEILNVRQRNKVRIKTKFSKKEVLFRENFPTAKAERDIYKYACPVCLLYFNSVLVSSCCGNYICRFCIGDLARKAKKDVDYVIRCTHCMTDDYKLNDVDPQAPIKLYTDTPRKYMTPLVSPDKIEMLTPDVKEFLPFGQSL